MSEQLEIRVVPQEEKDLLDRLRREWKELQDEQDQGWKAQWLDIKDYISPGSGLFLTNDDEEVNRGEKRRSKIIDNVAEMSLRTLASGLQGGLTSPSRPWFRLGSGDAELNEQTNVRIWLNEARDVLLRIFAKSNFYGSVHSLYEELGAFCTAAMFIEEDLKNVIRCRPLTIGEFALTLDAEYRTDAIYRRISMTVRQMEQKFGYEMLPTSIRLQFDESQARNKRHNVLHVVRPRDKRDSRLATSQNMAYGSYYFLEKGSDEDGFLRESGYHNMPFVAPRWGVKGVDTYGRGPGFAALPDTKQLQRMEKDKLKGLAKVVDPPMKAAGDVKPAGGNVVPGGVTFTAGAGGNEGYEAAYRVDLRLGEVTMEGDRVGKRIKQAFYNDLFLSLINEAKTMTAREVVERHDEKLMMIGPALERFQTELLDRCIDLTYVIAERFGLFPDPPAELQGRDLKVEYIGLLAQAQKLVGITAIEQTVGFAGVIGQTHPDVYDKINPDAAIDEYAILVGAPPKMLRGDDEIEQIREAREAAAARQAAMDQGPNLNQMAQAGKTASEIEIGGNPVLEGLTQGM